MCAASDDFDCMTHGGLALVQASVSLIKSTGSEYTDRVQGHSTETGPEDRGIMQRQEQSQSTETWSDDQSTGSEYRDMVRLQGQRQGHRTETGLECRDRVRVQAGPDHRHKPKVHRHTHSAET